MENLKNMKDDVKKMEEEKEERIKYGEINKLKGKIKKKEG